MHAEPGRIRKDQAAVFDTDAAVGVVVDQQVTVEVGVVQERR
jgi:hypothetical protein